MRALLGWILALGLAVSPAVAKAGGAAGEDSAATTKTDKPVASTTTPTEPSAAAAAKPTENMESELDELRDVLQLQARQIQEQSEQLKKQQDQMQALEDALKTSGAARENMAAAPAPTTTASLAAPSSASPMPVASSPAPAAIAATPQTAEEKPSPLYFSIGGAHFTPGGFMDLTNVFRTENLGTGIGSNFATLPYNNVFPASRLTEDRFSAQNSRITLRLDSTYAGAKVLGYLETDFLGNAATSLNVTSNANTLRMRVFFVDVTKGKWEFMGGQDWSMLTPSRTGISPLPGDIFYSQAVDTNYLLGLPWERTAQVRFLIHPSKDLTMGLSIENPQQYTGGNVTFPAAFTTSASQLDVSGNTSVPNLHPDIIAKIALDHKFGMRSFHVDATGLYRTFKINSGAAGNNTASAAGGLLDFNFELVHNFRVVGTGYWSDGGGRDIGNVSAPDLIVNPANSSGIFTITPVHSGSGIGGIEWQATPKLALYGYYSAAYIGRQFAASGAAPCTSAATCVGYGFAGSSNSNDRYLQEDTLGFTQTFWRSANYGAIQLMTQGSYASRDPWFVAAGAPKNAHLFMLFVNLRYALP